MKCHGCLLVVKDVAASKRFYHELFGCTVELDLDDYVIFKEGIMLQQENTWLGFIQMRPEALAYRHNTSEIYFEENDLDAFLDILPTANVRNMSPLAEQEWGQRSIRFYDPDGHVIEVGENMSVVIKRFLKSGMTVEETAAKSMFPANFVETCLEEMEEMRGATT